MRNLQLFVVFIFNIAVLTSCLDSSDDNCDCDCLDSNIGCLDAVKRGKGHIAKHAFQYVYDLLDSNCDAKFAAPQIMFYFIGFLGLYTESNSTAYKEMSEFTGLNNDDEIRCALPALNTYYANQPESIKFYYSDIVFSDYCNIFSTEFVSDASTIMDGRAINYDFTCPNGVKTTCNGIIEGDTHLYVKNAVPCSSVFNKNCTASKYVLGSGRYIEPFYSKLFKQAGIQNYTDLQNNTIQVNFVTQCTTYNYTENDDMQVIKYFLRENFFEFTLIYPKDGVTLQHVVTSLQDINTYNGIMDNSNFEETPINLCLPEYISGTSVTSDVQPLRKRGIVSSYFNAETSSIVDPNGESTYVYLSEGISTVTINNTISGNGNATDSSDDHCKASAMEILINRPAVFTISRCGSINVIGVGNVVTG